MRKNKMNLINNSNYLILILTTFLLIENSLQEAFIFGSYSRKTSDSAPKRGKQDERLYGTPFREDSSGPPVQKQTAQDRSFNVQSSYGLPLVQRIPNELDGTVDQYAPTLPHEIPIQSNIKPSDYLSKLHTFSENSHGHEVTFSSNSHDYNDYDDPLYGVRRTYYKNQPVSYKPPNSLEPTTAFSNKGFKPSPSLKPLTQNYNFEQQLVALYNKKILQEKQQQRIQALYLKKQEELQQKKLNEDSHLVHKKAAVVEHACEDRYAQLIGDIFIGNEMVPEVLDAPPPHLLELTYRTVRTFPGMRLTADITKFNPLLRWPVEEDTYYTIVMSNLDINSRKNRTLAEFWHWFVGNIPGGDIDGGEVIFDLLHPLVLPDGDGDHRFGYFVMKQAGRINYSREGGPTSNCSPSMSAARGPFRSTRDLMKKYGLSLIASTFLIVDHNSASDQIACEWQKCMRGQVNIDELDCDLPARQETHPPNIKRNKDWSWRQNEIRRAGGNNNFWFF